ncbi:MAG: putative molybdenum carrier protein [Desulfobacteraceae bacterium]
MITKIISGGQTGADRAALDAAIEMSVPHGGWIPKGRLTEAGPLPESYDLKEMSTEDYLDRTRQNVLDSDGTVVLSHGRLRGGSKQTAVFAAEAGKPLLHLDLETMALSRASEKMFAWIRANAISVLNVAGPRASQDPRIYERVKAVVKAVLQGLQPR